MAQLRKEILWPCPWEEVYEKTVNEPPKDLSIVRSMKDVKDAVVVRDEWEDGRHHVVFELEADTKVPKPVMALLPGGRITWVQAGVWHPEERRFHIQVDPHNPDKNVDVQCHYWLNDHDEGTHMLVELNVKARIPFIGGMVEKLVITKVHASVIGHYETVIAGMRNARA